MKAADGSWVSCNKGTTIDFPESCRTLKMKQILWEPGCNYKLAGNPCGQ